MNKFLKLGTLLWVPIIFFVGCDFSPPILNEIDFAQNLILDKKYVEAIRRYEKVLEKNPSKVIKVKILYQLGDLYSIYLSKPKNSIFYYESIREVSEDPFWLVKTEERLGEIYFNFLKDFTKSSENYKKLSNFTPKLQRQDFYQYMLALSQFNNGKLRRAQNTFYLIKKNPAHEFYVKSFFNLGLINFERKNWKKAIEYWTEYINKETRKDNIVRAKFLMANAYETMEDLKKAYNIYYSILGEYPNAEVIKNRLNSIYNRRIARKR